MLNEGNHMEMLYAEESAKKNQNNQFFSTDVVNSTAVSLSASVPPAGCRAQYTSSGVEVKRDVSEFFCL